MTGRDELIEEMRREGYIIKDPPPPPEVHHCMHPGCDVTDEDRVDWLFDFTVECAYGEEGWAREKRYVCEEHLPQLAQDLIALGFGSHRHGGINFLEVTSCPGWTHMDSCPTPEKEDDEDD
jgi:hypothetical protein